MKGGYYVSVAMHIDPNNRNKAILSIDQVIAVAKVIASRMQ